MKKKTDQEYSKNTIDSREVEGKKQNIQTKKQTPAKSFSTYAVGHSPPKWLFICTSTTTQKSPTGVEVNVKLLT